MKELKCRHCGRHLGEVKSIVGDILCPNSNCKGSTQFKIITDDQSKLINYKFEKPERTPKTKEPITNDDATALKTEVS